MDIQHHHHQVRYDRQIRLWGDEGQQTLQKARICVFGSSALAAEILKSLVLAGVGSFYIIDDAIVKPSDLGQNFFLEIDSIGRYRGECLVKLLTELNPSVHGQHSPISFGQFSKHEMFMLLNFSLIIGTNMCSTEAIKLDSFLFEHNIPFLFVKSVGMLGYLRISVKEHIIWNTRIDNDSYDLRIDSPFPELLKLANETDLNSMTHEQHSHTPYVLLYFKAIEIWKERHKTGQNTEEMEQENGEKMSSFPNINDYKTRKEIEKILLEMRQPDDKGRFDEENFAEATRNLLKSLRRTKVPSNVAKVLLDPKINNSNFSFILENSKSSNETSTFNLFWLFCTALNEFISEYGHLPISGQLPDMTSDSKRYAQLLGIYSEETAIGSIETAKEFLCFENITLEQCKTFCKNASKIAVQYGTSLNSEFCGNIKLILQKIEQPKLDKLPPYVDPLTWYLLLRAVDKFQLENAAKIPNGENDLLKLKKCLTELLEETKDFELIKKQNLLFPDAILTEICRFGNSELHIVSAIIGGVASQEAIKLCTNQYIPVDNSLIFDGNSQNASSFKI
ncbi:NEDD8-activating enzyme E1 regulatory subunit [Meloidogyne graminicola]|uniref:NEDD8-activating enzyme E1 regulatory subunit n=1 Tax=Meloidogyne graminicola TaxID=189291 RepID=A0A8S9ZI05_9BILA|nr:NEDD8-activating enzyme E1 regulatory subunit [Meloidogyne graminicola]